MEALQPITNRLIAKWARPNVTETERQDMYNIPCLTILPALRRPL
jgi:hypothetical protein